MLFQDPVYPVSYDKSDKFNEYLRMQGLIGMDPQALVPEVGFVPPEQLFRSIPALIQGDRFLRIHFF